MYQMIARAPCSPISAPRATCCTRPARVQEILERTYTHRLIFYPLHNDHEPRNRLEYTAPETLPSPRTGLLQPVDSKADMWSLGMILHKLIFFKLPYANASDGEAAGSKDVEGDKMDRLESEVLNYAGFVIFLSRCV
jgi:hypothetical protein